MNMNLFTDPAAPTGYERITLGTQVHQTDIPPAYQVAGVTKPVVLVSGPDGLQRPLRVELSFLQCRRCGAVVIDGVTDSVDIHNRWHGGEAAAPAITVEPTPPV